MKDVKITTATITCLQNSVQETLENWFSGPITVFQKCTTIANMNIVIEVNNMDLQSLKNQIENELNCIEIRREEIFIVYSEKFIKSKIRKVR